MATHLLYTHNTGRLSEIESESFEEDNDDGEEL